MIHPTLNPHAMRARELVLKTGYNMQHLAPTKMNIYHYRKKIGALLPRPENHDETNLYLHLQAVLQRIHQPI